MTKCAIPWILYICFLSGSTYSLAYESSASKPDSLQLLVIQMDYYVDKVERTFDVKFLALDFQLERNIEGLAKADSPTDLFQLIKQKYRLEQELVNAIRDEQQEITKIRYIKGLQVIKILYEKTLALDHHFASVSSLHEINKISNPNQYPEFLKVKEDISRGKDRKDGFDLSPLLGQNIYTSVIHSFVTLFTSNSEKGEKEAELRKIECILDFTLRMHQDLNTIYFETVFLQKSNEDIIEELNQLFSDYTKPIHYKNALKDCRDTDDWDQVHDRLNNYLFELEAISKDSKNRRKARRMAIEVEFSIDRLLQFIGRYNSFIDKGSKFYEKFDIMLNSYENETVCREQLPHEFNKLKESIEIATHKFNTAYKPVEVNGSKMKEILYGINEYD